MIRNVATILGNWRELRDRGVEPSEEQLLYVAKAYRTWKAFDGPGKEPAIDIVCRHTGLTPEEIIPLLERLAIKEAKENELSIKEAARVAEEIEKRKKKEEELRLERERLAAIREKEEAERKKEREKLEKIKEEQQRKARDHYDEQCRLLAEKKRKEAEKLKLKLDAQKKKEAEEAKIKARKAKLIDMQLVTLQLNGATVTGTAAAIVNILTMLEAKK